MQLHLEVGLGDTVSLKKPHPCGSFEWEVVRLGADIGLRCLGCGRKVLLPRDVFRRRLRRLTKKEEGPPSSFPQS